MIKQDQYRCLSLEEAQAFLDEKKKEGTLDGVCDLAQLERLELAAPRLEELRMNMTGEDRQRYLDEATQERWRMDTCVPRFKVFDDNFPDINDGTILDAGCSDGDGTLWLAKKYSSCHVVGMDMAEEAGSSITRSTRRNATFQLGNFYEVGNNPGMYDAIFAMNSLLCASHRTKLEGHIAIAESMNTALREEGFLCLSIGSRLDDGFGASAVLQKEGETFRTVHASERMTDLYFGHLPQVYGITLPQTPAPTS
ncbi:MAG: class I SAM-dependent methyltransferase [Candidatus Woesearchaeota archaeon]|nr:class I SAM-dependent methyltransferase [Candidatus Woesearchaeota archaeon]